MNPRCCFMSIPSISVAGEQGLPVVSGVWPWGGGQLPPKSSERTEAACWRLFSQAPEDRGLALWRGGKPLDPPASFDDWQQQAGDRDWVRLDQAALPARQGDGPAWQKDLEAIELRWLQPILKAPVGLTVILELGELGKLRFCSAMRWQFWRRRRPLWEHLQSAGRSSQ